MRPTGPLLICLVLAACSKGEESEQTGPADPGRQNVVQAPSADGPATIDCARASGQAEQAVCADRELAALDRLAGPGDDSLRAARASCGRADELRPCLIETYAVRIAERAKEGLAEPSTVTGPVSFRCGDEDVAATFINSEPGYVVLSGERPTVLPRVTAASGVRYEGRVDGTPWSFWNKGREAILKREAAETTCEGKRPID